MEEGMKLFRRGVFTQITHKERTTSKQTKGPGNQLVQGDLKQSSYVRIMRGIGNLIPAFS